MPDEPNTPDTDLDTDLDTPGNAVLRRVADGQKQLQRLGPAWTSLRHEASGERIFVREDSALLQDGNQPPGFRRQGDTLRIEGGLFSEWLPEKHVVDRDDFAATWASHEMGAVIWDDDVARIERLGEWKPDGPVYVRRQADLAFARRRPRLYRHEWWGVAAVVCLVVAAMWGALQPGLADLIGEAWAWGWQWVEGVPDVQ